MPGKTLLYFLLCVVAIMGCNHTSTTAKIPPDDSLQYYPPTPTQLSKEEFRHYYRKLSDFFDSTLQKNFNGGILIALKGAVVYEKYTGLIDLRKKDSLTDSTALHIASTSKTFTGIAILRLVQENKLSLNDSLTKFFPGLPYPGITVKMLLSHRSGLPNYLYFMSNSKAWDIKNFVTNADVLNFMYTQHPNRSFSPNTHFSYSNTNFALLALIVEKVTGESFPEYMQHKFFGPLQMTHTYIFTLKDTATATPSFNYNGSYWDFDCFDGVYGDKNVYTTPRDLLKWDQALYTDQVINAALLDSAFTPYSHERPSVHNYGLGWRLQLMPNGKKVIYHFGKWHGFNAAFARLTDEKATIIILGNRFSRNIYYTAHQCYDIFGNYLQREPSEDDDSPEAVDKSQKLKVKNRK